jgi:acyl dehydratase
MSRVAAIIENGVVTNIIEIGEGKAGDSELELRNAIDITGLETGMGWTYQDGKFTKPPKTQEQLDAEVEQLAKAESRSAAEAKLLALGLTTEDLKALLG